MAFGFECQHIARELTRVALGEFAILVARLNVDRNAVVGSS